MSKNKGLQSFLYKIYPVMFVFRFYQGNLSGTSAFILLFEVGAPELDVVI